MHRFDEQEKSERTSRLRRLLAKVEVPVKSEHDWQKLENDLFAALDDEKRPVAAKPAPLFGFAIPRLALGSVAAALILLCGAGIGLKIAHRKAVGNECTATLVSVHGAVAVKWAGAGVWDTLSSVEKLPAGAIARPGTVISPLAHGSAVVLLDKGSAIALSERSALAITASDALKQVCYLQSGSVLAKVNKRSASQSFEIRTPCAACKVVGTIFRVDANASLATTLSVYEGKVRMTPASGTVSVATLVATGRQMTVGRGGAVSFGCLTESNTPMRDISELSMLVEPVENGKTNESVVDITSQPDGAKVMIDNVMAGTTPLLLRESAGKHSLTLLSDGFFPFKNSFTVGRDRIVKVAAQLRRDTKAAAASPRRSPPAVSAEQQRRRSEDELRLIPEYVEALVNLSSGEYQQAIAILDSLSACGAVDIKQRMCIMETINACYKKLGDFGHASDLLEERLVKADSPQAKGQILWELATMRANCLGDYEGAEMALVEFLILQPDARWAHNAYSKLAETQYYLNKYKSAAETYQKHIRIFPDDPDIDRSMFNLACIVGRDMGDYRKAAGWYSRLINSFHASKYRSAALFRRAECSMQMGKADEAIKDYQAYLAAEPDGIWRSICIGALKKNKVL